MQAVRRVLVTGATGFVGHALLQRLCAAGHVVRCLVRRGSEGALRGQGAIARIEGDVVTRQGLEEGMAGCDAVIHLVGIIREHRASGVTFERVHTQGTLNVLEAAAASGIRRYLHMSALGTRPEAAARYHRTKWAAEEAVRASGLEWTIFRPSIVYGRGDGFVTMLASMVRRLPAVPVIGSGRQRLQPVPVEQVAAGFTGALELPATIKRIYEVGGPEAVTMVELLDLIGGALGRRHVPKVHAPLGAMRPLARLLHRLPGFPVTPDQLPMLGEDSVCDPRPFFETFELEPIPLAVGLERMLTR
ncbi:MAG TPA: complex I NDUFA9 subunit family protein [Candidatus Acidoferrum sp.]|nr:complex I NDUFA9 subunit family protein [Candidatus Acidoferrum sp.]